MLQGPIRWTHGDKRDDIQMLLNPIIRACCTYKYNNHNIKTIFQTTITGLKHLRKTYSSEYHSICHAIDLYINIISNFLKGENRDKYLNGIDQTLLSVSHNSKMNLNCIFNDIWNEDELTLLSGLLTQLNIVSKGEQGYYLSAISSILKTKESKYKETIAKMNSLI
jgi:hypothetical protein